jgi:hypothetical protein
VFDVGFYHLAVRESTIREPERYGNPINNMLRRLAVCFHAEQSGYSKYEPD